MIKIGKDISKFSSYSYQPKTKKELNQIVEERVYREGPECDFTDIDVSLITDMSGLFYYFDFRGNISNWNVSKVENMLKKLCIISILFLLSACSHRHYWLEVGETYRVDFSGKYELYYDIYFEHAYTPSL